MSESIYLVWRSPLTGTRFIVGKLTRNNSYFLFEYMGMLTEAEAEGWVPLTPFPYKKRTYHSVNMFPTFAARLPDRRRRDIDVILQKYGLTEYDEFDLLKKSGAKLPIDRYEFIE